MRIARKILHALWRLYQRLPIDGLGALPGCTTEIGRVQERVARIKWRRVAWWLRPPAILAARLAWIAACPLRAMAAVRSAPDAPPGSWASLVRLGLKTGKDPAEALLHRGITVARQSLADACLDTRQSVLLWSVLACPEDRALANDKVATAERMSVLGIPMPPTLAIVPAGTATDVTRRPWTDGRPLFIKPRDGMGGLNTMMVRPLGDGRFGIGNGTALTSEALALRLARAAQRQDLLVQPFLRPPSADADLSPHAPPGLRINVVRPPGGPAAVLSISLRIQPPDRYAATAQRGALMVPFEPDGDRLLDGLLFVPALKRSGTVPWNGAPLRGRRIADVEQARCMALRAANAFPGLPVIGFDLLLTADGPILLEANWGLAWFGLHLTHLLTGRTSELPAILDAWIDRAGERPLIPPAGPG